MKIKSSLFIGICLLILALGSLTGVASDDLPPVFSGIQDIIVALGSEVDYLETVTVTDEVDHLTQADIIVDSRHVNIHEPGIYVVYYHAADSSGNQVTAVSRVVVLGPIQGGGTMPTFANLSDFEIVLGTIEVNYLKSVKAIIDGIDQTSEIVVDASKVDVNTLGVYPVFYLISDATGNMTVESVVVTVIAEDLQAPTLVGVKALSFTVGTEMDLISHVTAVDHVEGDMTAKIELTLNDFDKNHLGDYTITYTVTDSASNQTTETASVKVIDDILPKITPKGNLTFIVGTSPNLFDYFQATDNYDNKPTITIDDHGININKTGSHVIDVTATDASGNTASKAFMIYLYQVDQPTLLEDPFFLGSVVAIAVSFVVTLATSFLSVRPKSKGLYK